MDRKQFKSLKEIFLHALKLNSAEREAFVNEACRDDRELFDKVMRLLENDSDADTFLEIPVSAPISERAKSQRPAP